MKRNEVVLSARAAQGRWVIPGDIHFPYHSEPAMQLLWRHCRALRPDHILLQGDTMDAASLSRFRGEQEVVATLKEEGQAAAPWLQRLRASAVGPCYIAPGNHDQRTLKFAAKQNTAFAGLEWHQFWPDIDWSTWRVLPPDYILRIGKCTVEHGQHLAGALSANGCQAVLHTTPGRNIVFGHTHRVGYQVRTLSEGSRRKSFMAANVGTLQDPDKTDQNTDKWTHAWAVLDVAKDGSFSIHLVTVVWTPGRASILCPITGRAFHVSAG